MTISRHALTFSVTFLVTLAAAATPRAEADGPVIELPAEARTVIEKYLGADVVGAAIEAPTIDDPLRFMGLESEHKLLVKHLTGKLKNKTRQVTISLLKRQDETPAWRLEFGKDAWYGGLDDAGNLVQHSSTDARHGVISRYTPPEPVLIKGMQPGTSHQMKIDVQVFDLARPDKKKHSGSLDVTYTYVGAYRVTVPAGSFDTVLFSWKYEGKVGPATVKDDQYWFFADGIGPVARIDQKDVSAFLVYRDKSKTAAVLVERR